MGAQRLDVRGRADRDGHVPVLRDGVGARLRRRRPAAYRRRWQLAALGLGLVLLVAAGEEISWGQRLFDLDTPNVLIDGNRQDELNLHNVDGLQQKAVLAQLAIALAGVLLPRFVREPWARAGLPCFAGYLAYRAGRGVAAVLGLGPAGDNAEAAELVLAVGFVALSWSAVSSLRPPSSPARPAARRGAPARRTPPATTSGP